MILHTCSLRVRYRDVDPLGTVYYSRYFEYFEVARNELMWALGLPYSEFEKRGFGLPVVEAYCNYCSGAKFDEELRIESSIESLPRAKLRINYKIFSKIDNRLIAEGFTIHAVINLSTRKAVRPPEFFVELIKKNWDRNFNET